MKFEFGKLVMTEGFTVAWMTEGFTVACQGLAEEPARALHRHLTGDWGDIDDDDKKDNDLAVHRGGRIVSAYQLSSGVKFWIITEADRSVTTFLLPEEY